MKKKQIKTGRQLIKDDHVWEVIARVYDEVQIKRVDMEWLPENIFILDYEDIERGFKLKP